MSMEVVEQKTEKADGSKLYASLTGVLLAVLAGASYSISSTIARQLIYMPTGHLYWLRCANIFVITLPMVLYRNKTIVPDKSLWLPLLVRSTTLGLNTYLRYLSFKFMPIALSNVISFSDFIYTYLLGFLFLKEACGVVQVLSVLVGLIGLGFICHLNEFIDGTAADTSFTNLEHFYGISSASAGAICSSISCIAVKKMKGLHSIDIVFYYALLNMTASAPIVFSLDSFQPPRTLLDGWFVILLGLFALGGQALNTAALKIYHTGSVTLTKSSSDIVLLFIWQMLFFSEFPDLLGAIGSCLIVGASFFAHIQTWCKSSKA